jgi:polyisoprenoid-binding protein YceI
MRFYLLLFTLAIALMAFRFTLQKETIRANKALSFVSYTAHHALHGWTGINKKVDCLLVVNAVTHQVAQVAVAAQVAQFDSDNASRDSHALEVLDALAFPKVKFTSTSINQKDSTLDIKGNLTFHGVVKPIQFSAYTHAEGTKTRVRGRFPISLTAFGVERPSFMMIATDDTLKIEVSISY